jgi:hypothetical protein
VSVSRLSPRWWALVAGLVGSSCVQPVGPARTAADYEAKAKDTAETVLSAVRTAELTVDQAARDRSFASFVSVSLGEAEAGATGALDTFESIQPPGESSDRLRDELTDLAGEAADVLADLRIAARRTDRAALVEAAAPLPELGAELEAFVDAHEGAT